MNIVANSARILLLGIVFGVCASFSAIGFVEAVKWMNEALFVTLQRRWSLSPDFFWSSFLFLVPAFGGLIVGALVAWVPERRPHNPADVIQAAQSATHIPARTGALTAIAALVGLGFGASVGQYGPLTHLGASIGSKISQWCKIDVGLGIGCGVAAAISTAFNAPIAGIIFAHEVVLRHYSLRAFVPVTVASTTGLFINDFFNRPKLFEVAVTHMVSAFEFFIFIVIGVGGALLAVLFMQGILTMRKVSSSLPLPDWLKPALAGLAVGLTAQWIPEILGASGETLRFAITPNVYSTTQLGIVLVAKLIATVLCLGFGFVGGVFNPALVIGIMFGAIIGNGVEFFSEGFYTYAGLEFYAICGMAAVTSPVIGAPLTTILIIFELTHNYELTTAVMVSVVFANLVASYFFGRSLFDRQLYLRGFDLSMGRDKVMLTQANISTYLIHDFVCSRGDDTLAMVKQVLLAADRNEAHVVDSENRYIGVLTLSQVVTLADSKSVQTAATHARGDVLHFDITMSVWQAMQAMQTFVGESIAVLDNRGCLLGVIPESALVQAYMQIMKNIRSEENATH